MRISVDFSAFQPGRRHRLSAAIYFVQYTIYLAATAALLLGRRRQRSFFFYQHISDEFTRKLIHAVYIAAFSKTNSRSRIDKLETEAADALSSSFWLCVLALASIPPHHHYNLMSRGATNPALQSPLAHQRRGPRPDRSDARQLLKECVRLHLCVTSYIFMGSANGVVRPCKIGAIAYRVITGGQSLLCYFPRVAGKWSYDREPRMQPGMRTAAAGRFTEI